jgi:hypothetical protein
MSGRCFSRSGWWQTLCGLDAANQGFGWSDQKKHVQCSACRRLIRRGEHRRWRGQHILVSQRQGGIYLRPPAQSGKERGHA